MIDPNRVTYPTTRIEGDTVHVEFRQADNPDVVLFRHTMSHADSFRMQQLLWSAKISGVGSAKP